ncbi:MAG: response regulator [Bdellovibrio sp.]|nr:response regulator [Bdellovibrio sp.]
MSEAKSKIPSKKSNDFKDAPVSEGSEKPSVSVLNAVSQAVSENKNLIQAIQTLVDRQKKSGSDSFDFTPVLSVATALTVACFSTGYAPLSDLLTDFELLIRQENMRARMKLRPSERISQLIPFFFAMCSRIQYLLESLSSNPSLISKIKPGRKRRLVIIDDSKTFQLLLTKICSGHPDLEIVGVASSGEEGEKLVTSLHPDVVTLDVHMPGMDGFTFLNRLMKVCPTPVVLVSSIDVQKGGEVFDALYQGALDFISKTSLNGTEESNADTINRIYKASQCSLSALMRYYATAPSVLDIEQANLDQSKVVVVGAGVGATRTLTDILKQLPKKIPPILVAQKIVPGFSKMFIQRLNEVYPFVVKEAEQGELLEPSKVYFAPDEKNMTVLQSAQGYRIILTDGEITQVRPSVDLLFDSAAMAFGEKTVGVLLPGNTTDGAQGLCEIRKSKGYTVTQDETDSPDPTLTREAIKLEAALVSAWGDNVAEVILDAITEGNARVDTEATFIGTLFEGEGPRVLIVDDSPTIRALVRYHLRAIGLSNFSEAKDGLTAWEALLSGVSENLPYELIICDQNMPKMLGLELLQKIRVHDKLKQTPFILVTSASDRETVMNAVKGGISDFVTKPMSAMVLAEKVRLIFEKIGIGPKAVSEPAKKAV